jgi:hypothetical protein
VLFSFTSAAAILFVYLLDVYEARLDTVMVVFNGVKNIATFGISYAVVPWNSSGFTVRLWSLESFFLWLICSF